MRKLVKIHNTSCWNEINSTLNHLVSVRHPVDKPKLELTLSVLDLGEAQLKYISYIITILGVLYVNNATSLSQKSRPTNLCELKVLGTTNGHQTYLNCQKVQKPR